MRVSEFDFELPPDRIALRPARPRDAARLLVVKTDAFSDLTVRDLPSLLSPGDVLVFNDTKVIPAALAGRRIGRGVEPEIEVLLHRRLDASRWLATHYDRGRVLVSSAFNVSPRSRIAMRDRIYPWSWELGEKALARPADVVDWVIVDRRAESDPVTVAVSADASFPGEFLRMFAQERVEIWRRR